jgi:hypothetical protein
MSLRVAVLELRNRAKVLEARLEALAEHTERIGGGSVHTLVEQVDKSVVDALGWLKRVRAANRRAIKPGAGAETIRAALADAQQGLDQLRRKEPRRLRGRALAGDLADLCGRHERARDAGMRRLVSWARETGPLVRSVNAAARAADAAMAACWRELASRPGGRVRVQTVTVVE